LKQYLKKYSDRNPERFNKEFILSRQSQDILEYAKDIFKALEILDEITVEEVTLNRDEASFGPVKMQHKYYKSILPSRLDKIHYKIRITPSENVVMEPIELGKSNDKEKPISSDSFIKEGDIYINKLIDNCFYINEGVRYFLIYQIVDNATYGTEDAVSLKSLLMPITLKQHIVTGIPEYMEDPIDLKSFDALLFSKSINPLLYIFGKDAYNMLVKLETEDDTLFETWQNHRDTGMIDKFNEFFGTDFKFAQNSEDLVEDGRVIFRVGGTKADDSCFVSVNKEDLNNNLLTQGVLGSLLDMRNETKKKKIGFTYDQLISPWFWIETLSAFFTKNNDYIKKFNKIRTMLISLNRLMDDTTRKILKLDDADKENTLTIIRYIMKNFDELMSADSQDLRNKRLRLYEYQLYPLRKYFSDQIYRVLNSPTRSRAVLDRVFSNLSPMFVIKQTVTNELLRYYNSTNDLNLWSSLLKFTFRGPQSLTKTVTNKQRDLHPSYAGRLSLIASSASDPGLSGTLTPFIEEYDSYFEKQK
jgi:hypothetical protein